MSSSIFKCRKCGSDRVRGIGLSATVPIVGARCEACGYISGVAAINTRGSLPGPAPHRFEFRFQLSARTRRLGLAFIWIAVGAWIAWADYLAALNVSFPVSYILPVLLAANSGYRGVALGLSLAMPLGRLSFPFWGFWTPTEDPLVACFIQSFVLGFIALLLDRRQREVHKLRKLMRVCAWCKRVHVRDKIWQPVERFIAERSGNELTHGLCPVCAEHFSDRLSDAAIPAGDFRSSRDEASFDEAEDEPIVASPITPRESTT